jgi:hypothetical protein
MLLKDGQSAIARILSGSAATPFDDTIKPYILILAQKHTF